MTIVLRPAEFFARSTRSSRRIRIADGRSPRSPSGAVFGSPFRRQAKRASAGYRASRRHGARISDGHRPQLQHEGICNPAFGPRRTECDGGQARTPRIFPVARSATATASVVAALVRAWRKSEDAAAKIHRLTAAAAKPRSPYPKGMPVRPKRSWARGPFRASMKHETNPSGRPHRPRPSQGRGPRARARLLLPRAGLCAHAANGRPRRLHLRGRLPSPHRPQHVGKRGRVAAPPGTTGLLPSRDPLPHAGGAGPTRCTGCCRRASRSMAPATTASARPFTCTIPTATASSFTGTGRSATGRARRTAGWPW